MDGFIVESKRTDAQRARLWKDYADELENDVTALIDALAAEKAKTKELEAKLAELGK